jgi:mono/diheme cytochrome c family protein
MRALRIIAAIVVVAGLVLFGLAAFAWRSEIPAEEVAEAAQFDPALTEKGAQLAAVGNCIACHTVPGSKAFAGGLAVPTPFGTIYSTNITPDPETGIGRWSEVAFQRAMREGVDREGRHLYPAFPYDHFTRVTDEDNRALYAYLMTREPVSAVAPPNELQFPLNFRPLLAGWKFLYLDEGPLAANTQQSEAWNRGAYLAEGLGHCGFTTFPIPPATISAPRTRTGISPAARLKAGRPTPSTGLLRRRSLGTGKAWRSTSETAGTNCMGSHAVLWRK